MENKNLWERTDWLSNTELIEIILKLDPYGRATELDLEFTDSYVVRLELLSMFQGRDGLREELCHKVHYIDEDIVEKAIEEVKDE